jgi:hypothetical protein
VAVIRMPHNVFRVPKPDITTSTLVFHRNTTYFVHTRDRGPVSIQLAPLAVNLVLAEPRGWSRANWRHVGMLVAAEIEVGPTTGV